MKKTFIITIIFAVFCTAASADGPDTNAAPLSEGSVFPYIYAQSLEDTYVSLPFEVTSKAQVSHIIVTYKRPDDKDMETWVRPFMEKYGSNTRTAHFSLALVGDVGFINGLIFNGMRDSATPAMKKSLLVYFHDKEPYKKIFGIKDDSLIYNYILDQDGIIRLVKAGKGAAQTDIDEILKMTADLLAMKNKPLIKTFKK